MEDTIELLDEISVYRSRNVKYISGKWDAIQQQIPDFELVKFESPCKSTANPFYKQVMRLPIQQTEVPMPIGLVSNSYTLAKHKTVALMCIEAINKSFNSAIELKCELGLSELSEWMNFRVYFPKEYDHDPGDGKKMALRLECYNSVDGSSRLQIMLGWFRYICSNGLVIGETVATLNDIHNHSMDLVKIPEMIKSAINKVELEKNRLKSWHTKSLTAKSLNEWVDNKLLNKWGTLAATRVYHICQSGQDVEFAEKFVAGLPTEKKVNHVSEVPGSAIPAKTLYDVSQALSWVATNRKNAEQKTEWQKDILELIQTLNVTN